MPFCTIVEFEFSAGFDRAAFDRAIAAMAAGAGEAEGRIGRMVGVDDTGARVIEVWRTGADAMKFAQQTAPGLATVQMPPPSRVIGFELTEYDVG